MANNLGVKALEAKIDDYVEEYVSDYVSTYMSISEDQIEANKKVLEAGFEDFVIPVYESVPFTTIQNRAQVTRSLKAIAGVERVHVKALNRLENEFGPNGERVFEASNKDNRVRFVGTWNTLSNAYGSYTQSTTTNDFMEVSFYGTGLNIIVSAAASAVDVRPTVDNGAEGSDIFPAIISTVTGSRNYAPNIVIPVVSSLTLGLHTVKLRVASSGALEFVPNGFEILNERTDLAVYSGAGISNGSFNELSSLTTSTFNQGIVGTRGARVVKYIENGTLKSAVQEVDSVAKYLTLADHTNEEVVRRINFREFGANRADDFSTLAGVASSRAFTLEDGTTTLIGTAVTGGASSFGFDTIGFPTAGTSSIMLTFIGTGLDIVCTTVSGFNGTFIVQVDGSSVGLITAVTSGVRTIRIASGLPYGTHTVKIFYNTVSGDWTLADFITYQPKKPLIPVGTLEVADYNVVSDHSECLTSIETISQGVIRKYATREMIYSGTWSFSTIASIALRTDYFVGGFELSSSTLNSYVEYTFFGTGFDYRAYSTTGYSGNVAVTLNGSSLTSANFPTATTTSSNANMSINLSTGVMDWLPTAEVRGARITVKNLPLGRYTVRFNNGTAGANISIGALDVITPIHINNPTLKVGSQSLKSAIKYSPEKSVSNAGPDLSKAKAWVTFGPSQIFSSYNVSAILKGTSNVFDIFFEKSFKNPFYVVAGTATSDVISSGDGYQVDLISRTSSSAKVGMGYNTGIGDGNNHTNQTLVYCSIVFFGELSDE